MTIDSWLDIAIADAKRRGLPELEPLLDALARATRALRAADFNEAIDDTSRISAQPPAGRNGGRK